MDASTSLGSAEIKPAPRPRRQYRLNKREQRLKRQSPFTWKRLVSLIVRAVGTHWHPSRTELLRLAGYLNAQQAKYRQDQDACLALDMVARLDDLCDEIIDVTRALVIHSAKLPPHRQNYPFLAELRAAALQFLPPPPHRERLKELGEANRRRLHWMWAGPALADAIETAMRSMDPSYPAGTGEASPTVVILKRIIPAVCGNEPPVSTIAEELRRRRKIITDLTPKIMIQKIGC